MVRYTSILAARKVGHLNIKTKMFDFEAHILIGWLANTLTSHSQSKRALQSQTFLFLC